MADEGDLTLEGGCTCRAVRYRMTSKPMIVHCWRRAVEADVGPVIVACADPHDTWERYDENDPCWLLDTCAAIQNMLLAIHDLGLGAVWVFTFSKRVVRELAGIPKHWQIVSIVPFGYFEGEMSESSRRPLSEVAFLEDPDHPIE